MGIIDKAFVDNIVKHNGYYNGDDDNDLGDNPRCVEITQYNNSFGGIGYGLTFEGQINKYTSPKFFRDPICYWKYDNEGIGNANLKS